MQNADAGSIPMRSPPCPPPCGLTIEPLPIRTHCGRRIDLESLTHAQRRHRRCTLHLHPEQHLEGADFDRQRHLGAHRSGQRRGVAAPVLSDAEAADLKDRRKRLSPADRAALQRWRVDRAWGLNGATPSPELLDAHDDGAARKVVMRWAISDTNADPLVARHDRVLADGLMGPKIDALRRLGLPAWLKRRDWFGARDAQVADLAENARACRDQVVQKLGLRPGKRDLTVLRQLLGLIGARLEVQRRRQGCGRSAGAAYIYRVVPIGLPDGISDAQVLNAWCERVGCVPKPPLQKERAMPVHAHG